MPGAPRSATCLAAPTGPASHSGSTAQPSRSAGASDLLTVPSDDDPLRREALQRADRFAVVAELRVVVVLEMTASRSRAQAISSWRRSAARTTPVGHWCAGVTTATRAPLAREPRRRCRARRPAPARSRRARRGSRPSRCRSNPGPRRRPPRARRRQGAQHDRKALLEPGADDDLVGVRVDGPHPAQVGGEHLAQLAGRRAHRRSRTRCSARCGTPRAPPRPSPRAGPGRGRARRTGSRRSVARPAAGASAGGARTGSRAASPPPSSPTRRARSDSPRP